MTVTWLGQAGLLFKTDGLTIMTDPYFSDSVEKVNPKNKRRMDVPDFVWEIRPNVLIFTHDHLDHYDPETAPRILKKYDGITVLCAPATWDKARLCGGNNNYVRFARKTQWTQNDVIFRAVYAEHSDPAPIGVLITAESRTFYVAGDTLFSSVILEDIPEGVTDTAFLPVNGAGNNMNATDATRLADALKARRVVPIHIGMFDDLTPDIYKGDNKWALTPFKEYEL